mmetsp:Transcript_21887/g.55168  ORF Transcript_21887/g.55168 Transcript_21887/m.55168 type:complete len:109 (-) Transcript_21887:229-555(-)
MKTIVALESPGTITQPAAVGRTPTLSTLAASQCCPTDNITFEASKKGKRAAFDAAVPGMFRQCTYLKDNLRPPKGQHHFFILRTHIHIRSHYRDTEQCATFRFLLLRF